MKVYTTVLSLLAVKASLATTPLQPRSTSLSSSDIQTLQRLILDSNRLPIAKRFATYFQSTKHSKRDLKSELSANTDAAAQESGLAAWLALFLGTIESWTYKAPVSRVAEIQEDSSTWPNAKKKKIRYGPYRLPPISEKNLESYLLKQQGLAVSLQAGVTKPSTQDHVLLDVVAGLEFDDGTTAEVKDGAWLHHAVLVNVGPGVVDTDCSSPYYDYFFENGNEKEHVLYANQSSLSKSGYHLRQKDVLFLNTEVMNMDEKEKWVWLTLNYDYIDHVPAGYKEAKVMWMSIGPNRCASIFSNTVEPNPFGESNITALLQPKKTVLSEFSFPWVAPKDGYIMGMNGHLHNGGTEIEVFHNGESICKSSPKYGPGGASHMKRQMGPVGGVDYNNTSIDNIVAHNGCWADPPRRFKKGDKVYIRSDYDFTKHPGTKNGEGQLDSIMGMIGTLIAFGN
ncbi:hypothetical protein EJ08DRAFT_660018 [Tothia fuscella]|uniref:Uncharacterized protein n=1 Tax=Tothia fuscella TaxID=1048955 RepID=A0A9P4NUB9_9PEZI|nr:hypothetical protein EJ08DRAFT_660018 [Tothia fuscella]